MDTLAPHMHSGIICIEMHTTGEPTRIVVKGYPDVQGTLLEQRAQAKSQYDHIRKRLMLEPAGHADMYGAILRPHTELTNSGDAHIGVLFTHNEGYSTMCGHATIALGRFLLDTHDLDLFPKRDEVKWNQESKTAELNLHAPCGLVRVTVPVTDDGKRCDASRSVSFISVPAFSTGANVQVDIPQSVKWRELGGRNSVQVDFCYGGAFTCLVSTRELGFGDSGLRRPAEVDQKGLGHAAERLKLLINTSPAYQRYIKHYQHDELDSLYTLMIVDKSSGEAARGTKGAETGLCFFADHQIDRSPTGSAVTARVAHAYALGQLEMGESWTYHSLVSNAAHGRGGFVGKVVEKMPELFDAKTMLAPPVRVRVEGYAYYVGSHIFVAEKEDPFGKGGFLFSRLGDVE